MAPQITWPGVKVKGDLVWAPIAKGVTNGDTHDHVGGDGAQIAYSGLSGLPNLALYAQLAGATFTGQVIVNQAGLAIPFTTGLGCVAQYALGASLDQSDVIFKRDVDGGGTWAEAGANLTLKRDITNVTAENGVFLRCTNAADAVLASIGKTGGAYFAEQVGIGGSPSYALHVQNASGAVYGTIQAAVNNLAGLYLLETSAQGALVGFDGNSNNFFIATNSSPIASYSTARLTIGLSGTIRTLTPLILVAGTATAGTAPLKFTAGVVNTTPEAGAVEWDGTNLWITQTGGTRKQIAYV